MWKKTSYTCVHAFEPQPALGRISRPAATATQHLTHRLNRPIPPYCFTIGSTKATHHSQGLDVCPPAATATFCRQQLFLFSPSLFLIRSSLARSFLVRYCPSPISGSCNGEGQTRAHVAVQTALPQRGIAGTQIGSRDHPC